MAAYLPMAMKALPYAAAGASAIRGLFGGGRGRRRSTMDKRQRQLYKQQMAGLQGQGPFADLYQFDPGPMRDMFQQTVAGPALQQFKEEVTPNITGSFRGQNLENSSYLGQALGKAGSDVQTGLDRQLAQMLYKGREDALNRRAGAMNKLLGMQTQAIDTSASPFDEFLSELGGQSSKYILENIFKRGTGGGGSAAPQAATASPRGGLPAYGGATGGALFGRRSF